MKFLIIGAGAVGISLAERLANSDNDVTIVDESSDAINNISADLDLQKFQGNGSNPDLLIKAGIKSADFVLAVTSNDEVNISSCLVSKLVNPSSKRIARIRHLNLAHDLIDQSELDQIFDLIINPPKVTAEYLTKLLTIPNAQDFVSFANGKLIEIALEVKPDSEVANKKIASISHLRDKIPVLLNAIVREDTLIVPRGTDRILPGDLIYFLTKPEHISEIESLVGLDVPDLKNIMISGASPLAKYAASILESQGKSVKIIIPEETESEDWIEHFNSTLVIKGSPSDTHILQEENIADVDAFLALSLSDEENIMTSILAKKLGAGFTVSLVNNKEYLNLVRSLAVDAVVNSQLAAALAIVRFIYAGSILSASTLLQTDANLIEIVVNDGHHFIGKNIKELNLPYGILISAIIRDEDAIIPRGDNIIQAQDRLVIFFIKSSLKKLENLLNIQLKLLH